MKFQNLLKCNAYLTVAAAAVAALPPLPLPHSNQPPLGLQNLVQGLHVSKVKDIHINVAGSVQLNAIINSRKSRVFIAASDRRAKPGGM